MGGHHPAEYFAESIVNPNAVIVTGPGHTGADGLSIMPDFRDSLTLAETIDLVAYIRSLTGGDAHDHHADATAERERVAGDYRVRLAYAGPGGGHDHDTSTADRGGQGPGRAPDGVRERRDPRRAAALSTRHGHDPRRSSPPRASCG